MEARADSAAQGAVTGAGLNPEIQCGEGRGWCSQPHGHGQRHSRHDISRQRLSPGKTLDNFDLVTVPMLSKARVMALAAGDAWLNKASNLLLFGPPGAGKSDGAQPAAAMSSSRLYEVMHIQSSVSRGRRLTTWLSFSRSSLAR
jgi:IstB-like ATP binding protein